MTSKLMECVSMAQKMGYVCIYTVQARSLHLNIWHIYISFKINNNACRCLLDFKNACI